MSEKKRGLGRGLGALIPTGPAPTQVKDAAPSAATAPTVVPARSAPPHRSAASSRPTESSGSRDPVSTWIVGSGDAATELVAPPGAYFAEIPVASITPNPKQPRRVFDEDALDELIHSIREIGLLQPIVVRPLGDDRFELVMGERRWRAHQVAQIDLIPAIVRDTADEALLRDALLENLHRSQLNSLEEAAAYQQLLSDFACTHEELAQRIGRSRPQISNTIRLLKLPPSVQRRVAAGVLSAGHARALLAIDDVEAQERMAARIVAEGLSVRMVEELVTLGETGSPEKPTKVRGRTSRPELTAVAERLADVLETRVQITATAKGRGRVVVDFASHEDLQRIVDILDPKA